MNYFVAQIILAAQRRDTQGWMQILVFVVIAVIYALSSILKAKSNKTELEDEEQPARKPPESASRLQKQTFQRPHRTVSPAPRTQYQPQVQSPRRKVMRPEPAATSKPVTKKQEPALQRFFETPELPEISELPLPGPQPQPRTQGLPEIAGETLKGLRKKQVFVPEETPQIKYVGETLLDYSDTDKLKRAILHYEILGKPLSLRGPSEQIIGF